MTLLRDAIPSPNYSSRGGSAVSTIVLHTAEGATTYQSLGSYFQNPASEVSSHVGIDDTPGTVGEYVRREGKAWTASSANPWSVQAELCAFAEWDAAEWDRHPQMLQNTADWIAEEAAALGIPLSLLDDQAAQSGARGVCQHADLGSMGGGHWDCGPAFPIQRVLQMAGGSGGGQPAPDTEVEKVLHIVIGSESDEWWLTDWITKRYLNTSQEADQIIWSTVATGGRIEHNASNGPVTYDQRTVDRVPRVDA